MNDYNIDDDLCYVDGNDDDVDHHRAIKMVMMTVMIKIMMTILVNDRLQYGMITIIKTNHNQLVGRLLLRVAELGEESGGVELPYGGGSSSLSPSSPYCQHHCHRHLHDHNHCHHQKTYVVV